MPTPPAATRRRADLVGREEELALWQELLGGLPGRGAAMVVLGEPGIGKTRLLDACADEADRHGLAVVRLRCRPTASAAAYLPLVEALAPLARPGGPLAGEVPAPYRAACRTVARLWETTPSVVEDDRALALAESVARVLSLVAKTAGVAVLVDDVQDVDSDTLAVLEHLVRTVDSAPVVVCVTARDNETSHGRVQHLRDAGGCVSLHLARLGEGLQQEMVRRLAGSDVPSEALDFLVARAEGLPLAVEELLAEMQRQGSLLHVDGSWQVDRSRLAAASAPSLEAAVRARLRDVDQTALSVAVAVGLLGDEVDWQEVVTLVDRPGDVVVEAFTRLAEVGILESSTGGRVRYRHGLLRDAVRASAPPSLVREIAARAAARRAAAGSDEPDVLSAVSALWDLAGDADAAAGTRVEAAWRWLARGALSTAIDTARAAFRAPVPTPLRREAGQALGEALTRAGRFAEALRVIEETLQLSFDETGPEVALAHCRAARCALETGDRVAAGRHLDAAEKHGGAAHTACALRAVLAFEAGDLPVAAELAQRAVGLAEASGDVDALGTALLVQARVMRAGDPEDALPVLERLVVLAGDRGLLALHERALLELGLVDRCTTNRRDRLDEARRLAEERASVHTQAVAEINLWPLYCEAGELEESERLMRHGLELSRRHRLRSTASAGTMLVLHEAMRGRFASAEEAIARLQGTPFVGGARFYLELLRSEPDVVQQAVGPAVPPLNLVPDARPSPVRGFQALLAAVVDDDDGPAHALLSAGVGAWYNRGLAKLALATVAAARGDRAAAHELGTTGYGELAPFRSLAALAVVLLAPRALQDGWGAPQVWLTSAREQFDVLGNDVMRRRTEGLMRAHGIAVPRRGRGDAEVPRELRSLGVTSREMDVLLLVARHLTNAEIAERLVVSPRTVDTHVSRLLSKAGVESRGALARLLDGASPTGTAQP